MTGTGDKRNRTRPKMRRAAGRDVGEDVHHQRRLAMVSEQIEKRGVTDPRVLAAMAAVPRHRFVPKLRVGEAYRDHPLPIAASQTISQPYIVALMAEAAEIGPDDRVLEVGTGSGYGAAVLGELAAEVVTVERHRKLADAAAGVLTELGYAKRDGGRRRRDRRLSARCALCRGGGHRLHRPHPAPTSRAASRRWPSHRPRWLPRQRPNPHPRPAEPAPKPPAKSLPASASSP